MNCSRVGRPASLKRRMPSERAAPAVVGVVLALQGGLGAALSQKSDPTLFFGDPCGRRSTAWAEERSQRHVPIVPTWENCGRAGALAALARAKQLPACFLAVMRSGTGTNRTQPMWPRASTAWLVSQFTTVGTDWSAGRFDRRKDSWPTPVCAVPCGSLRFWTGSMAISNMDGG